MQYWDRQGKFQAEYDQLSEQLIPGMGQCDTFAGELLRAISRIYYDAYNNGFCNNTSGAMNFLFKYLPEYNTDEQLTQALWTIRPLCNTSGYSDTGPSVNTALDTIVDGVIIAIQNNAQLLTEPIPCEIFDLQDPTADYRNFEEDEDEDDDDYY